MSQLQGEIEQSINGGFTFGILKLLLFFHFQKEKDKRLRDESFKSWYDFTQTCHRSAQQHLHIRSFLQKHDVVVLSLTSGEFSN